MSSDEQEGVAGGPPPWYDPDDPFGPPPDPEMRALGGVPSEPVRWDRLRSTFGAHEMEVAAAIVATKAAKRGTWDVTVRGYEFDGGGGICRTGFELLLGYGWLRPSCPTGRFAPSKGFVERVVRALARET